MPAVPRPRLPVNVDRSASQPREMRSWVMLRRSKAVFPFHLSINREAIKDESVRHDKATSTSLRGVLFLFNRQLSFLSSARFSKEWKWDEEMCCDMHMANFFTAKKAFQNIVEDEDNLFYFSRFVSTKMNLLFPP